VQCCIMSLSRFAPTKRHRTHTANAAEPAEGGECPEAVVG
jgi:hypothetical protein